MLGGRRREEEVRGLRCWGETLSSFFELNNLFLAFDLHVSLDSCGDLSTGSEKWDFGMTYFPKKISRVFFI